MKHVQLNGAEVRFKLKMQGRSHPSKEKGTPDKKTCLNIGKEVWKVQPKCGETARKSVSPACWLCGEESWERSLGRRFGYRL